MPSALQNPCGQTKGTTNFFESGLLIHPYRTMIQPQDQKVVRQLFANKGQTVQHGFTSRPEWHGPLPERPTYCDCCIQTSDGKATGRAMIPSVLNNRVYSRDDNSTVKALADRRAEAMIAPTAPAPEPLVSSSAPAQGTPTTLGSIIQNIQTAITDARDRLVGPEQEQEPVTEEEIAAADAVSPAAGYRLRRMRTRQRRAAAMGTLKPLAGIPMWVKILVAVVVVGAIVAKVQSKAPGLIRGGAPTGTSLVPRPSATGAPAATTMTATSNFFS